MRAVIQRVKSANVKINEQKVGEIDHGLLILFAVHQDDKEEKAEKFAEKILKLRIFSDKEDKMNLSVKDIQGEILAISQFTLYADTRKGNRPSFIESAKPDKAIPIYNKFLDCLKQSGLKVEAGKFGAMMEVELINDGPVTIIMDN